MFLRCKVRRKDGKQHRYWSVVENTRVAGGRVVQRHVLYLGEINDTQELAWRRSIAVVEDGAAQARTLSLFPEDRCEGLLGDASIIGVRLSELRLRRPRQWGACWLALLLQSRFAQMRRLRVEIRDHQWPRFRFSWLWLCRQGRICLAQRIPALAHRKSGRHRLRSCDRLQEARAACGIFYRQ